MSTGIIDYFPKHHPRSSQVECINWLEDRISKGAEYLIIDARTGFGKSSVARCLTDYMSKHYGFSSFIFTSTKMLQDQYYRDSNSFNRYGVEYGLAKGRGNFLCKQVEYPLERVERDDDWDYKCGNSFYAYTGWFNEDSSVTCSDGVCTKLGDSFSCPYSVFVHYDDHICDSCRYLRMKRFVNESDVALLNYDVKVSDNVYVKGKNYPKRYLCVYDEAHNIEGCVLNYISLSLSISSLEQEVGFNFLDVYWEYTSVDDWLVILNDLVNIYYEECIKVEDTINNFFHNDEEEERLYSLLKDLETRRCKIKRVYNYIVNDKNNWVVELDKYNGKVEFKPLNIHDFVYDYLYKSGDVHVFMSGSIINAERFCKDNGIPYNPLNVFVSEGVFDFKRNNPIIRRMVGSMTSKNVEKTKPLTIPVLKNIFNKHRNEKGLIHCNSKKLADYIMETFRGTRFFPRLRSYGFLKHNKYPCKEDVINDFKSSRGNDVLVSYSLEEGVDLPYDECRFQVFYKAPFLFLGDTRVKEKRNSDPEWYMLNTIRRFQQMYGRGMRAVDDFCVNYVLDSSFNSIFNHYLFPRYMKEAIV